jgi:hypothetical protein
VFGDLLPTLSLVLSATVILVAGIFTIRSTVASTWKENYGAEQARRKQAEEDADEQRAAKHEVLNELGALKLKTDITPLMEFAAVIRDEMNRERGLLEERLRADHAVLTELLEEILRNLAPPTR